MALNRVRLCSFLQTNAATGGIVIQLAKVNAEQTKWLIQCLATRALTAWILDANPKVHKQSSLKGLLQENEESNAVE